MDIYKNTATIYCGVFSAYHGLTFSHRGVLVYMIGNSVMK